MLNEDAKIRSALVGADPSDLKAKYDEIYSNDSDVWLYRKSHGVHTVIASQIDSMLRGARVLDAGCGAGRLSLMLAERGAQVVGLDFSEAAIAIARLCSGALGKFEVEWVVGEIDTYDPPDPFDIAAIVGTLEHVPDPVATLGRLNALLKPGGTAVVSCPNFLNFRGHGYMTLLTLLDLPMSLADVRQVSYREIRAWAAETGFALRRSLGAIYRFAWDDLAAVDMVKRVPAAVRDSGLSVEFDFKSYEQWLRASVESNRLYLETLESIGILRRIERMVEFAPSRPRGADDDLWDKIQGYLREDVETDPFWSDVEPFCWQGGEAIYLLEKVA